MAGRISRYPSTTVIGLPVMPKCTVTQAPNGSVLLCLKQRTRCSELHDNRQIHHQERIFMLGVKDW